MKTLSGIVFGLFLISASLFAQDADNSTLLRINNTEISLAEFAWLYEKNNSGTNLSSVEDYLDMYILFRLKVEDAKAEGFHQSDSFKEELLGYRKQLARGYLTDQSVKEKLLQKVFKRSTEEINAYHILIKCAADASPADTLIAYYKALNIRERVRLGEPFASIARGASDDQSARTNGGNLGYFTVFQTPLTFEDAAYSMKPGQLSQPVRTADGYHIIKVQDKRPASGKIKVAHIMKYAPAGSTPSHISRAKIQIDSIYQILLAGSHFDLVAKEYSDDNTSKESGGELPWFGTGEMVHEFSEAAFKILRDGDISEPFRTMFGWHIVKRIDKRPPPGLEESRNVLESKMSQSYLESISKKSFVDSLKKEYNFSINKKNLNWLYSLADSTFRSGSYRWYEKDIPSTEIYSYSDVSVSMSEFTRYINLMGKRAFSNDSIRYINSLVEMKSYDDLVKFEDSKLEQKYPEFRFLINEFHDGILLFEISNKKIWSRIDKDSPGLKEYWESRKEEYLTEAIIDATIFTIAPGTGKSRAKKLEKEIKKARKSGFSETEIVELGKTGSKDFISSESGRYKKGENLIMDQIKWSPGSFRLNDKKGTHLIYVSDLEESEVLPFEDARSFIINDFQNKIEMEWHQQLREEYAVKIDEDILRIVKERFRQ